MRVPGRRARWLLAGVLVVGVAVPLFPILSPPTQAPGDVDAVVVLGGGGERLPVAQELVADGAAALLVISRGEYVGYPKDDPDPLCDRPWPFPVECFEPAPSNTIGEARTIADLASERGWDAVAVVTSGYHVARAGTLIRQCSDVEVRMVAAPASRSLLTIAREWLALVSAVTLRRAC